jgi:hypothetical protein
MKILINIEHTDDISNDEALGVINLTEEFKSLHQEKYSHDVENFYIRIICVNDNFKNIIYARPIKYLKNPTAISLEINAPFFEFKKNINSPEYLKKFIKNSIEIELENNLKLKKILDGNFIKDFIKILNK